MIRTIYRGYDITSEQADSWKVYDPKNPSNVLSECSSEETAMSFVDRHRRDAIAKAEGR